MNKPVAWIELITGNVLKDTDYQNNPFANETGDWIALYTHPVKEYKEPSVKEIDDLWLSVINNIPANDHRPREWHFARAILRKAQEK